MTSVHAPLQTQHTSALVKSYVRSRRHRRVTGHSSGDDGNGSLAVCCTVAQREPGSPLRCCASAGRRPAAASPGVSRGRRPGTEDDQRWPIRMTQPTTVPRAILEAATHGRSTATLKPRECRSLRLWGECIFEADGAAVPIAPKVCPPTTAGTACLRFEPDGSMLGVGRVRERSSRWQSMRASSSV